MPSMPSNRVGRKNISTFHYPTISLKVGPVGWEKSYFARPCALL